MIWHLPGPQHFVRDVGESLRAGRHVVLALPAPIDRLRPLEAIADWLFRERLGSLTVVDVEPERSPEENLGTGLGAHERTIDALLRFEHGPSRFVALCVPALSSGCVPRWLDFLARLTDEAHEIEYPPYQLVLLGGHQWLTVISAPAVSVHPWWGVCSSLDVDTAVAEALRHGYATRATERVWIRALCRGLVPQDPILAQHLVQAMPLSEADVHRALDDFGDAMEPFAHARAIGEGRLGFLDTRRPPLPRSEARRARWQSGGLDWVPGLGEEVHLLAIRRHPVEVRRRLWRGQMEIILPLVERVRQCIIARLGAAWGPEWPAMVSPELGAPQRAELVAACDEIGPLAHHLSRSPSSGMRPLAAAARRWRDVRNALAHAEPVAFDVLCGAFEAARAAGLGEREP